MLGAAWVLAFLAFASVWKVSEEIGISTWWIGPRSQPQPLVIRSIPFVLVIIPTLAALYNVRRAAWLGVAVSLALGVVAVFDISRSGGLAAIEFAIAACELLVSLGAVVASVRPGQTSTPSTPSASSGPSATSTATS